MVTFHFLCISKEKRKKKYFGLFKKFAFPYTICMLLNSHDTQKGEIAVCRNIHKYSWCITSLTYIKYVNMFNALFIFENVF